MAQQETQAILDTKIAELERRLDKVDHVYEVITESVMALPHSEFRCSVCQKLRLNKECEQPDHLCPLKIRQRKQA